MAKKADRYTVLEIHLSELPEKIKALDNLGLHWFCKNPNREDGDKRVDLFVFFDQAGMDNFLADVYERPADQIRAVTDNLDRDQEYSESEALSDIKNILGY